jgi:two-component system OmpR family response regulator
MSTPNPATAPSPTFAPSPSPTAVVVEDDAAVRDILIEVFESAGFTAIGAENGMDGVEAVRLHNPRITTIDINMPGIDGFETVKRVRAISETYIVLVTARADESDAVLGLSVGADDYVTKPFRLREFRARVEAMLRRPRRVENSSSDSIAPPTIEPAAMAPSNVLAHRDLRLDMLARTVHRDNVEVALTRTEFDLMQTLLESNRRARSKEDLALVVRGDQPGASYVSELDKRAIEAHVANLRRKLGDSSASPRYIETVRGVGYRLTATAAAAR